MQGRKTRQMEIIEFPSVQVALRRRKKFADVERPQGDKSPNAPHGTDMEYDGTGSQEISKDGTHEGNATAGKH